jgi:hypothetical protein
MVRGYGTLAVNKEDCVQRDILHKYKWIRNTLPSTEPWGSLPFPQEPDKSKALCNIM